MDCLFGQNQQKLGHFVSRKSCLGTCCMIVDYMYVVMLLGGVLCTVIV